MFRVVERTADVSIQVTQGGALSLLAAGLSDTIYAIPKFDRDTARSSGSITRQCAGAVPTRNFQLKAKGHGPVTFGVMQQRNPQPRVTRAMVNPYQSPTAPSTGPVSRLPIRWLAAFGLLAASVGFVVVYTTIILHVIPSHRPKPIWPTIIVPFTLSIVSAIRTRNVAFSPMTCLLGITSGSLVFGVLKDWGGAETHIVLPIAAALSLPSLVLAINRRQPTNKFHHAPHLSNPDP